MRAELKVTDNSLKQHHNNNGNNSRLKILANKYLGKQVYLPKKSSSHHGQVAFWKRRGE
jgi:hypothetical protein